jgi:hypothetical protein
LESIKKPEEVEEPFEIIYGQHRLVMVDEIDKIIKRERNNKDNNWFYYRVFFHAVELFDRLISIIHKSGNSLEKTNPVFAIYVCLYISIKYFSVVKIPPRWEDIVPEHLKGNTAKQLAEKYEKDFLKKISFRVYKPTIYEYFDTIRFDDDTPFILDKKQTFETFRMYLTPMDIEVFKGTNSELFAMFIDTSEEYSKLFPE